MKAKDIRKGTIILYNGAPHTVMEFHHRTPGNLRAFVQAKVRNVMTGVQSETRFSSTEELVTAEVYTFPATFLYQDGDGFHFMNSESFETVTLSPELLGDNAYFLQEGLSVGIATYEERPISIQLPKTVVLVVAETEPELRGATASNSPKPAKTDTGLAITVPTFIKVGERVIVDTEEGAYLSRAD